MIAAPNRHESIIGGSGISAPLYFMVSLAAFGCMNAVISAGARIAAERSAGPVRTFVRKYIRVESGVSRN
jgi:ABC-2 type transport system permease protein